jgi:hypothetical protein
MNNRLKLYDSTIYTYLEPKDKAKFRKIAFRHKKSISEFNRYLILLVIKLDEKKKLNKKNELTEEEITDVLNIIVMYIL